MRLYYDKKMKIKAYDKIDLIKIMNREMEYNGFKCDLNHIDVSQVEDMSHLFQFSNFKGNISQWDVSSVISMKNMFYRSDFNGDISNWNTQAVVDMSGMFIASKFNGDISNWNISNVIDMHDMFKVSELEKENQLPYWYFSTQEERVNAYLKYNSEKETKHIESFLQLSIMNDVEQKIKLNKI